MNLYDLFDLERPDWMRQAACRGLGPDLFYPSGETLTPAVKVCARCPVRTECATHALDTREEHGVWGGLSERGRRSIRKSGRQSARAAQALQRYEAS